MKLPELRDLVGKNKKVYFSFFRDGELWYKCPLPEGWPGLSRIHYFEFPIPPEDMKGAIFRAEDKSILFMRFIRKHLEFLAESMKRESTNG